MSATHRDPEKTRGAILDAAEALFAREGFNGTAMSQIAEVAGVTQSLIHHHFGSKAKLWSAVLERFDSNLPPVRMRALDKGNDYKELEALIQGYFRALELAPNLARLDAWGKLENPGVMTELDKQALVQVRDRIAYLQRRGALRRDIPPEHIIIAIQALVKNWWLGRAQYLSWLGSPEKSHDGDSHYFNSLISLLFEGLLPR